MMGKKQGLLLHV